MPRGARGAGFIEAPARSRSRIGSAPSSPSSSAAAIRSSASSTGRLTAARPLPPIILASAGTVHRIGPHRLYVALARRWAALGFHVLRLDLSGIGDSPAADDGVENVTYPRDGFLDLGEAMDWLADAASAERFIVAGLCSGGDFAFQMGLRDPRVAGAVILNPRTFCVNDLAQVETGNPPGVLAAAGKVAGGEGEAAPSPSPCGAWSSAGSTPSSS